MMDVNVIMYMFIACCLFDGFERDVGCCLQVGGQQLRRRLWLRYELDLASNQQKLWQYKVEDRGNTEVAEQTFAQVQGFGSVMRVMSPVMAEFFLMEMLITHNEFLHYKLQEKGMHPSCGDARMTPDPFPLACVYEEFTADVMLDPNMVVL